MTMRLIAGASVDITCPKCKALRAKVALDTPRELFYRCSTCSHTWLVGKPSALQREKAS